MRDAPPAVGTTTGPQIPETGSNVAAEAEPIDADLRAVSNAWPDLAEPLQWAISRLAAGELPEHIEAAVLTLIDSATAASGNLGLSAEH